MLQDPHWIDIVFQRQKYVRTEMRPAKHADDKRAVSTIEFSNLERAVLAAAKNGHAPVVSILLDCEKRHGPRPGSFESRDTIKFAIEHNHAAIVKAIATANPAVMVYTLDHKNTPLDYAIRRQNPEIVTLLLSLAAAHPTLRGDYTLSRRLALAAGCASNAILKLLINAGYSVPRSGALQAACSSSSSSASEKISLLHSHGADVNELLPKEQCPTVDKDLHASWTPLHYAARAGREDIMALLVSSGAKEDVGDLRGKTAQELFWERKEAARLKTRTTMFYR
jgi:ankyrin repeat protein